MAVVTRERNEAVERMETADMPPEATPPVRGMGPGSAPSAANVKGIPTRSTPQRTSPRPVGGGRRGTTTDLLSIFGSAGVAEINVNAGA